MVLLPVKVHLDGMIDDEVSGAHGINLLWVTAQFHHRIPHGSKVHHGRDTATRRETACQTTHHHHHQLSHSPHGAVPILISIDD